MLSARRLLVPRLSRCYASAAASRVVDSSSSFAGGNHTPYFPDEPMGPSMLTNVPGPESKRIIQRLDQYQDTRSVFFVAGLYDWDCN